MHHGWGSVAADSPTIPVLPSHPAVTAVAGRHAATRPVSAEPAPGTFRRALRRCAQGACWAGLFASGMAAGWMYGGTPRTALLAAGMTGPFALALAFLHYAGRRRLLKAQAAWREYGGRAIDGGAQPDPGASRLAGWEDRVGGVEERLADCEDTVGGVDRRVRILEAGLEAAFDAAGISGPHPVLTLVREPSIP